MSGWERDIRRLVDAGYSDDEIADHFDRFRSGPTDWDDLPDGSWADWREAHGRRRVRELLTSIRGQRPMRDPNAGPVATPEQAREAYRRLRSDRKAAEELGVSRTQVRRLRGVDK